VVQVNARMKSPEEFRDIVVARRNGVAIKLWQLADVVDGPQEVESLALYNGQRTVLLSVQKSQGENTIAVVDGLRKPRWPRSDKAAARGREDRGQPRQLARIRVSVANVQRTLIEGALLTIGIVFLFLNSWRSTVITGLTLPIALIGTFLFMYVCGFTINTVTLMALSLCVGLLIDDAIVVRENIVRHVQMGKPAHEAALDGTNEIGLAVLATTLSIVAVFLPIGFMGGIVGKFFHEFGITIVAAVLISMFVSFTLDPMLSSVWHDPQAHGVHHGPPVTLYDKTIGRVTGCSTASPPGCRRATRPSWLVAGAPVKTVLIAAATFVGSFFIIPLLGAEFVPKADFSRDGGQLLHAGGLVAGGDRARARQIDAALREMPEVRSTPSPPSTAASRPARSTARLRAPGRPQGPPAQRRPADGAAARAAGAHSGHHRHQHRRHRPGRRQDAAVLHPGPRPGRARPPVALIGPQLPPSRAWWTWTARSSPTSPRWPSRCGATPPPTWA
jgi:HAE1 family hydrophobic/amphiphilic exporter-1